MDELVLEMLRDDLDRRVTAAAATMADTLRLLTAARELAGDAPGGESLRAAIEELTAAHADLLVRSR
ncbi:MULTISPECIES: hypothetical protein [unclassified Actinoplanes]|uniref:hypothetical protein n=1 Tax=unclassified Actinoplanes TaxID=2626549 RepID=UPI00043A4C26|nr:MULTISPECIES: hypothetical protein [unclassified Actinoplanes]